jgi:hypothetical protein
LRIDALPVQKKPNEKSCGPNEIKISPKSCR